MEFWHWLVFNVTLPAIPNSLNIEKIETRDMENLSIAGKNKSELIKPYSEK